MIKAEKPFRFYTRLHLTQLTGLSATDLHGLVKLIADVPGSSIYHHTHRFLQQHQQLSPEPPNDFAHWVAEALGESQLGEQLASIDIIQYATIRSLREKIIKTIEKYLQQTPVAAKKFTEDNKKFHFIKSISFVVPTDHIVYDLEEFAEVLKKITVDSIYFHIFESRLRLEKGTNDFSFWIETSLGNAMLAKKIAQLDPYTQTMEDLRGTIIRIVRER